MNLLQQIPELHPLFSQLEGKRTFLEISNSTASHYPIPEQILDYYHMTENRFIEFFTTKILKCFHI